MNFITDFKKLYTIVFNLGFGMLMIEQGLPPNISFKPFLNWLVE